jgi:chromosome segregation ATPase|tara:strand:+ start:387 stop:1181 length:795 start_codon:yes stop_codon:yes gene_type:complete
MTKDKPGRREPFIARRDESAPLQAGFTEPKEKPRASSSEAASEPKKLGFIVLCFLVGLLSLSLGALSAFSWRQSQSQAILQHEFDDLALRLASSDESVAQSGAALTIKLNQQEETLAQHWSEIKKLWGVANDRNKKAIKALQLADREATNNLKKIQQSHASLEKNVDGVHAALKNVQAEIKKMSSASLVANAQTDDFHNQLKSLEGKIKTFDSEASDLRKLIEKNRQSQSQRLTEFEQAVKSMDAFRRQTNEKFSRLHPASSGN